LDLDYANRPRRAERSRCGNDYLHVIDCKVTDSVPVVNPLVVLDRRRIVSCPPLSR
jgi:hypothetical protein